ncbi:hypothetical protein [Roseateles chitinivorans]|uniref:hypothetical protein n=1 Tax=Roseateles chitinivorans TaxID=2917965 RepID=UPI003D670D8E
MTTLASNLPARRTGKLHRLDRRWWLLFGAFIAGGIFEVIDNILGLRQLNFESSAPAFVKVAKEAAILWLLLGLVRRNGLPKLTAFGFTILSIVLVCVLGVLLSPPPTSHAQAGLIYYLVSLGMMLATCALIRPADSEDFARNFMLPVIVTILVTQGLEIALAPASLFNETNLFGLDRRAGIAAIPTTAGMLGVVGFATLRGWLPRLLSLAVIGLASSSISLICVAIVWMSRTRHPVYALLAFPLVAAIAAVAIASRAGLDISVTTRLDILADSVQQLALVGPSEIGSLATAKSVALNPMDSFIVDSMYLEALHVFGLIPGTLLLAAMFATIYRRIGGMAMTLFALAGIGYLALEAWIVWFALLFAFQRPDEVSSGPR